MSRNFHSTFKLFDARWILQHLNIPACDSDCWDDEHPVYRSSQPSAPYHRMQTTVCQSMHRFDEHILLVRAIQARDPPRCWRVGAYRDEAMESQSHEHSESVRGQLL